jgi:hydroxyacylglutathione hydrolase
MGETAYTIIQIDEKTWRIEEEGVRFFLLAGEERALLIDSGMEVHHAREIARSLTELPLSLLNTHGDPDHIGSNAEFEEFYMSLSEAACYYKLSGGRGKLVPVREGQILDLGGRPLEIVELPGHTPGSIAVLDRDRRILFSGDPVQNGNIFLFGPHREIHAYMESLLYLEKLQEKFDDIYPSHGTAPVKPELIRLLYEGTEKILAGEITGVPGEFHGQRFKRYDIGAACILYDGGEEM